MRLAEFRLEKYGPFESLTLGLDTRPGCINIITAPNGAGKSVLRRGFGEFLFGIATRTPMDFRFGYADMKLGARLLLADGTMLDVTRRKGRQNTLLDAAGAPLDPARLGALPDEATLHSIFALDTELLRAGGNALLKSGGRIADALLNAAGLPDARALKNRLLGQSADLTFIRRDSRSPYNLAITDFKRAREAADQALLRPRDWDKLNAAVEAALAAKDAALAAAAAADAARDRLTRMRLLRAPIHHYDQARAWLDANPDAPHLPSDLAARFEAALRALADITTRQQALDQNISRLTRLRAELPEDGGILAASDSIEALANPAGATAGALADQLGLRAQHQAERARVVAILRDMGSTAAPEQAQRALADAGARAAAEDLLAVHTHRREAAQRTRLQLERLRARLAHNTAQLAHLPPAEQHADLDALLRAINASGDPAGLEDQLVRACRAAQAETARLRAALPLWSGTDQDLRALKLRTRADYAASHAALVAAETALDAASRDARAAAETEAAEAEALARTQAQTPLADRDAIRTARAHRDSGWRLIARLAFDAAPLTAEEQLGFAGTAHLRDAYEGAVARADELADLRADHAAAVERVLQRRDAAAAASVKCQRAQAKLTQAADAAAAHIAAWRAMLPDHLPQTLRHDGLTEFIVARADLLRALDAQAGSEAALGELHARHAAWSRQLAGLLGREGDFFTLLALAEQAAHAAQTRASQRRDLEKQREGWSTDMADAQAEADQAESAWATWQNGWRVALHALGRPAEEPPAATEAVLKRQDALAQALDTLQDKAQRLAEIEQAAAGFIVQVTQTLTACGLTDPCASPEQALAAAQRLRQRLDEARAGATRRATLSAELAAAEAEAETLRQAADLRQAALDNALREIGATDPDSARQILERAETRAAQAAARAKAEADIAADGQGHSLEALRAELAETPESAMAAAALTAEAHANGARDALVAATEGLTRATQARDAAAASTAHGEAIALQMEAAARAANVLEEALTLRLAATLLDHALARFEARSQPELIRRIGTRFARLTDGAFDRLSVNQDATPPDLILHQAARPHETKALGDLSEGTRDQLFLAFRLAAIEEHSARLPFVADDILQSFDDARAAAALRALLALSERVQVILLTHHDHIGALAARLPPGSVHRVSLAGWSGGRPA